MKKRISRILGLIMLIIAIAFIVFALNHPENELSLEQYYYLVTVWFIYSCDSHVAYCA